MVRQPFGGPVSYGNGACTFKYGGNDPCSCKAFEPGDPDCCANCGHSQVRRKIMILNAIDSFQRSIYEKSQRGEVITTDELDQISANAIARILLESQIQTSQG
ncbi:unnamed protein product [Adineta steineri]|uniref:Uncharacterized protein n=1 Tax=Adineta steineri TaxID=433720 RepID=A0A815E5K7_9BILA|nr:unnamed protein product [Adineta steineri]